MKKNLIGFIVSFFLASCAISRAPSLRLLEERADYDRVNAVRVSSSQEDLKRSKALVTDVFIHPHELPSGDYFLGGWIRTVLKEPRWNKTKATIKSKERAHK